MEHGSIFITFITAVLTSTVLGVYTLIPPNIVLSDNRNSVIDYFIMDKSRNKTYYVPEVKNPSNNRENISNKTKHISYYQMELPQIILSQENIFLQNTEVNKHSMIENYDTHMVPVNNMLANTQNIFQLSHVLHNFKEIKDEDISGIEKDNLAIYSGDEPGIISSDENMMLDSPIITSYGQSTGDIYPPFIIIFIYLLSKKKKLWLKLLDTIKK